MKSLWLPVAAFLAGPLAVGCKREKPEIDGVESYRIGVMEMKDYHGAACRPLSDGVSHCATFETIPFAGQRASIDLYFASDKLDAKLVEVLLAFNRCKDAELERSLSAQLGPPAERSGGTLVWPQERAFVVARLAAEPGVCEVSFLDPGQKKRLATLRKSGQVPAGP